MNFKTLQAKSGGDCADIVQHLVVSINVVAGGWSPATIMHDPTTTRVRPENVPVVFPISNFNALNASGSASAGERIGTECSPLMFAVDLTDCNWRVAAKRREQSIAAVCASSAHSPPRSAVSKSSRSTNLSAHIDSLLRLLPSST